MLINIPKQSIQLESNASALLLVLTFSFIKNRMVTKRARQMRKGTILIFITTYCSIATNNGTAKRETRRYMSSHQGSHQHDYMEYFHVSFLSAFLNALAFGSINNN